MTEGPENRRRSRRLEHELPVAYRTVGSFLTDWAINISQGGMFINSRKPLPLGTEVEILIQLPTTESPIGLNGKVSRVVPVADGGTVAPGMGIEFTDLDPSKREQLDSLVTRLHRALGF